MLAAFYILSMLVGIVAYIYCTHRQIVELKERERIITKALKDYNSSWKIDINENETVISSEFTKKE